MRLLIFLVFTLLFSFDLLCQDVIVLRNGEEISVVVKEVGTKEIKYVKFNNQSGPLYAESKANIFMIKYENGTKDVFTADPVVSEEKRETSKPKAPSNSKGVLGVKQGFWALKFYKGGQRVNKNIFVSDLRTDPQAYAFYSKYGTTKIIDRFFGGLSMVGAIFAVSYSINNQDQPALVSAVGGLLAGVISRVYRSKAKSNLELAVLTYNKNLE